jgi:hypothetical protein
MPFVEWDPIVRASAFGGVFLVSLLAILWVWYDSSGRSDRARWYWRLPLSILVLLTTPAVVLAAANLDVSQQDLMRTLGWLAIGSAGVALLGAIAYAVWGRTHTQTYEPMPDTYMTEVAGGDAEAPTFTAPTRLAEPATIVEPAPPASPAPAASAGPVGAYLFVKSGPDQGKQYPIANQVTVGRGKNCGITLSDARVSAEHAQIKREGAGYVFLDLKSTNGSFLLVEGREERLRTSQALVDGDVLRMGQTTVQFILTPRGGHR